MAMKEPDRQIVFFGIGFETTAPATAQSILLAERLGVQNYSVLCAHVLVPPAMHAILSSGAARIDGLIAPGHVCAVTGTGAYEQMSEQHGLPIVVTGFEPLDIMQAVHMLVVQLESGGAVVQNQYARAVTRAGNTAAQRTMQSVFEPSDRQWRGIGRIPYGGLAIRSKYGHYNAEERFKVTVRHAPEPKACIAGQVLQGLRKPTECPSFARTCDPTHPIGAPMVSSEGACAAYYRYNRESPILPGGNETH